ncbi:hypothetical protein ACFXO7_27005, partial [Nocardia tengchongensis]
VAVGCHPRAPPPPHGCSVAIAAAVAAGQIAAVVFLYDPSGCLPHDHDCQALIRQCCVHNVPFALNLSTAAAVTAQLAGTQTPRLAETHVGLGAARPPFIMPEMADAAADLEGVPVRAIGEPV